MYKISIIVTIYNMQEFIFETLDSIFNQLESDVQVICINDGSTDKSAEILNQYVFNISEEKKLNFLIYHQTNQGVSCSRNRAVELASGEYISFVDADDKILPNYIKEIKKIITNRIVDIIDFNMIDSSGKIIKSREPNEFNSLFKNKNWHICSRVFLRNYILKFKFQRGIYYEDLDLMPFMYVYANSVEHISDCLYWYRENPHSITRKLSKEMNAKTIHSLKKIFFKYAENNIDILEIKYMRFYLLYMLCTYDLQRNGLLSSLNTYNNFSRYVIFEGGRRSYLKFMSFFEKTFMIFPRFFLLFYSVYHRVKKYDFY